MAHKYACKRCNKEMICDISECLEDCLKLCVECYKGVSEIWAIDKGNKRVLIRE